MSNENEETTEDRIREQTEGARSFLSEAMERAGSRMRVNDMRTEVLDSARGPAVLHGPDGRPMKRAPGRVVVRLPDVLVRALTGPPHRASHRVFMLALPSDVVTEMEIEAHTRAASAPDEEPS